MDEIGLDEINIIEELEDVKNIINHTYQLVRDVRYRDGIEKIEGAYENFLRGAVNLGNTLNKLEGYMHGVEELACQNLIPQIVREYHRAIMKMKSFYIHVSQVCEVR